MLAKEYLQRYRKANILIKKKKTEIANLKSLLISITPNYNSLGVQSSGLNDKTGNAVSKIIDLSNELEKDIERLIEIEKEITNIIDQLNNSEMIDLLYRRYLNFEKWEKIAYQMNYSIRGIYRLHGKCLQKINAELNKS